jgi:hypothetical protein
MGHVVSSIAMARQLSPSANHMDARMYVPDAELIEAAIATNDAPAVKVLRARFAPDGGILDVPQDKRVEFLAALADMTMKRPSNRQVVELKPALIDSLD